MSILIKGGRVITAADDYVADVFVDDERISLIGESLVEGGELVAKPGVGQFVTRARFGEELRSPAAATA